MFWAKINKIRPIMAPKLPSEPVKHSRRSPRPSVTYNNFLFLDTYFQSTYFLGKTVFPPFYRTSQNDFSLQKWLVHWVWNKCVTHKRCAFSWRINVVKTKNCDFKYVGHKSMKTKKIEIPYYGMKFFGEYLRKNLKSVFSL